MKKIILTLLIVVLCCATGCNESYDADGYNSEGYNWWGYDRDGFDKNSRNFWGQHKTDCYNSEGYNWWGYDKDGFDKNNRNFWGQHKDELKPKQEEIRLAQEETRSAQEEVKPAQEELRPAQEEAKPLIQPDSPVQDSSLMQDVAKWKEDSRDLNKRKKDFVVQLNNEQLKIYKEYLSEMEKPDSSKRFLAIVMIMREFKKVLPEDKWQTFVKIFTEESDLQHRARTFEGK